ncbi:hypothetical protein [Haloarchaeobius sp. TZWWS8]|uniref:hypothetical protein n=1 Tax=Haloarchaeobius sp. TZWWS8 TaxID=3446121 RepID=UPI003EBAD695
MDENVDAALRFVALQLAVATAAIHLWVGWPAWYAYTQAGRPFTDPRVALFVLSSLAVLVGIGMAAYGVRRDYVYGLGIVLMLCYLLGWLFLGGHPDPGEAFAPAWEATGHTHGSAVLTLFEHLVSTWTLLVSKVVEVVLLAILVVLLREERRNPTGSGDGESGETDAESEVAA